MIAAIRKLFEPKIRINQVVVPSGYRWLSTILLVDDREAERLSDWSVGYYHCSHCHAYQGFAHQLPPLNKYGDTTTDPAVHNERNAFWRKHAHGDGRIIMFERDMEIAP